MSGPVPKSALDGHCSVIDNNTLYVLSSDAFQSLPLKENATWSTLSTGVAVTGPACIRAVPGGDESQAALYVVGGTAQDSNYAGLQRYFFNNQTWETLTPPTLDMQGRTSHSAAYLNDSSSIAVYAGSQPSAYSDLSSQTFVVSTHPPYNIRSFTSKAPPANLPILLPWDSNSAVMVGGAAMNNEVWTFGPDQGWTQLETKLDQSLGPQVRGTIMEGSDGSKVLQAYDASASPNEVSQIVLLGAGGKTATNGQTIGSSSQRKRDLTLQNWPSYNSSDAPTATRPDYSVAQNSAGLSVLSGGNDNSPVNIFDEQKNAWVDNGLFFDGKANNNQSPLVSSTPTSSSNPSSTSSAGSATSSAPPLLPGGSSKDHMLKVLGITLGVLCGIAACFILALLLMRWRKQKRRQRDGYVDEKADRMSFQDRGAPYMKEAGVSQQEFNTIPPNHRFLEQNSSNNSFAIMAGKFGKGATRNPGPAGRRGSTESTRPLKPNKADISRPMELSALGAGGAAVAGAAMAREHGTATPDSQAAHGGEKRSSGWSRYFAPTEPQLPSAYNQHQSSSKTLSHYTTDSQPELPGMIDQTQLVPPLDFSRNGDGERISRVMTGSPAFNHSADDLARRGSSLDAVRAQRAHLSNGSGEDRFHLGPSRSNHSFMSDDGDSFTESTFSELSNRMNGEWPADGLHSNTSWTPESIHNMKPTLAESALNPGHIPRPPSSNYTNSVMYDRQSKPYSYARNTSGTGFFPNNRDREALRPSSRQNRVMSPPPTFPAPPTSSSPAPNDSHGMLGVPGSKGLTANDQENRESTMTVFPRGVPSAYYANRYEPERTAPQPAKDMPKQNSDMSWVKLGI